MASKRILITGGAGFIGAHLAHGFLLPGHEVGALDCLSAQVHGSGCARPDYLARDVDLHLGDVRDRAAVRRALKGVDAVFHFAAAVGVGQSMYAIAHYTASNNLGTAVLLEALIERPVERLVVASSMSIYGEGLYRLPDGTETTAAERTRAPLQRQEAAYGVFNVGSGHAYTVREVARRMGEVLGKPQIRPEITGKYRMGDIRHCFADISHARKVLGFEPQVPFVRGLEELAEWLRDQVATDRVAQ